jgi:hypothetical protein
MSKALRSLFVGLAAITFAFGQSGEPKLVHSESVRVLYFEDLKYPLVARLNRVQGAVVVLARLDEEGNVIGSAVITGPKELIGPCESNIKKWRFQPNPEKVAVVVYRFKIEGLCNLPCASEIHFEPPNFVSVTTGEPVVDHR